MTTGVDRIIDERVVEMKATMKKHGIEPVVRRVYNGFTAESARAANEKKYADVQKKPATATVRVEVDVIELVKKWPTSERVHRISEAIRSAVRSS